MHNLSKCDDPVAHRRETPDTGVRDAPTVKLIKDCRGMHETALGRDVIFGVFALREGRVRVAAQRAGLDTNTFGAVCPGWVATDVGGAGGRPADEGATSAVWGGNAARRRADRRLLPRRRRAGPLVGAARRAAAARPHRRAQSQR